MAEEKDVGVSRQETDGKAQKIRTSDHRTMMNTGSPSPTKKRRTGDDSARSGSAEGRQTKMTNEISDSDYGKTRARSQQKDRPRDTYGIDAEVKMKKGKTDRRKFDIGGGNISAIPAVDSDAQLDVSGKINRGNQIITGGSSL